MKSKTKVIVGILTFTLIFGSLVTVNAATNQKKFEFQSKEAELKKSFSDNVENNPQDDNLDNRLAEGEQFKDSLKQIAKEEHQQGLGDNDDTILKNHIDANRDINKSVIQEYENDPTLLNQPNCKANYDRAKKVLDAIQSLEDDYNSGKITAKEGLDKFNDIGNIN